MKAGVLQPTRRMPASFAWVGSRSCRIGTESGGEWGAILGDDVMAAAFIDRIVRDSHIVNIRGNSYRMRHHTELWKALHSDGHEELTREVEST